jgi:simple sugar transport system permease protein
MKLEKQQKSSTLSVVIISVIAVVLSLLVSLIIVSIAGYSAWDILSDAFMSVYFTKSGTVGLLVYLTPIAMCALSVVVSAKAGLWNVGVEGQFVLGAIVANGIGLFYGHLPAIVLIPLIFAGSFLAGGLLCMVSAIPRVYFGISEILTTILVNSIIGFLLGYLSNLAWRDTSSTSPQTLEISESARIQHIPGLGRVHWGALVGIALVFGVWIFFRRSTMGFKFRAIGASTRGARYAGLNTTRLYLLVMFLSGAIAGLSGMFEVVGVAYRMRPGLAADFGLSGFVIAWVARLNPLVILIVSYLFAGLTVVGFKLQMSGLQSSIVLIIKGLILFFILAGETFTYYKIVFPKRNPKLLKDESDQGMEAV